jgi:hypothetical protein
MDAEGCFQALFGIAMISLIILMAVLGLLV